jgi:hypothetical protein
MNWRRFIARLKRNADWVVLSFAPPLSIEFQNHAAGAAREIRANWTIIPRLEKEIPDAARFARGLIHGNPLIDQIKARGGVDPDRIVDALAQALRQEFGTDPGRMPLQAIVFSAGTR